MNTKKALVSLAFVLFFITASTVQAAGTDNRYFVKSNSWFIKKSFQVRNVFDSGFTANLSDVQLKMAKFFGVEVTPVKKLNILAVGKKDVVKPVVSKLPVNQVGWGVKSIYGDLLSGTVPSGGDDVSVAILDTGVLTTHSDLKGQVSGCSDFSGSDAFVKNTCEDKNGHGTLVAGIVAANGGANGKGIYGMAPRANLMAYKVCSNDGTCFADDVANAIVYAADNGANIILLSFGSDSESTLINESISYASNKGALIIAAAGNDGPYPGSIDYPASNISVVSVGAVDGSLSVPDWSARGNNEASISYARNVGDLEVVAPGVNVESTAINGDYATSSGTSMAAAHIAGLMAKEWQGQSSTPAQSTRELLYKQSQDVLPFGDDNASGWGMPQL
ncbi:MAG: S8 family serine peptidase [Candidatus Pacebacteria bacterium]|nr:S8 family serine peptidase [Candidatus Paceibacterota bacterium]